MIRRILQRAGLRCAAAAAGADGLQWFLANPAPAAVVMDVLLPDLDGLEALRHLRDPRLRSERPFARRSEDPP
ncbi:MAG: response regulator [Myxococcales bacterium]|nr:response regulator [Myxococcales bacterium]